LSSNFFIRTLERLVDAEPPPLSCTDVDAGVDVEEAEVVDPLLEPSDEEVFFLSFFFENIVVDELVEDYSTAVSTCYYY